MCGWGGGCVWGGVRGVPFASGLGDGQSESEGDDVDTTVNKSEYLQTTQKSVVPPQTDRSTIATSSVRGKATTQRRLADDVLCVRNDMKRATSEDGICSESAFSLVDGSPSKAGRLSVEDYMRILAFHVILSRKHSGVHERFARKLLSELAVGRLICLDAAHGAGRRDLGIQ